MAYKFTLNPESLKRRFSVYVVVAKGETDIKLYVGKTGDNRAGCNPLISRCGNHFSYNKIHSQVRNKLTNHENRMYTYIFDHFDEYRDDEKESRTSIDRINEMERWLNREIQKILADHPECELLNPFSNRGRVSKNEHEKRASFRTKQAKSKIDQIVKETKKELGLPIKILAN